MFFQDTRLVKQLIPTSFFVTDVRQKLRRACLEIFLHLVTFPASSLIVGTPPPPAILNISPVSSPELAFMGLMVDVALQHTPQTRLPLPRPLCVQFFLLPLFQQAHDLVSYPCQWLSLYL